MTTKYDFYVTSERGAVTTEHWQKDEQKVTLKTVLMGFGGELIVEDGDDTFDIEVVRRNKNEEWQMWWEDVEWDTEEAELETDDEELAKAFEEEGDEAFEMLGWELVDDWIETEGELEIKQKVEPTT